MSTHKFWKSNRNPWIFMHRIFLLILLFSSLLAAQTTLSGRLGGMTLDSTGNPYLVTETITVPTGKTLKINAGCIFLFKEFTGVVVEGAINVAGTREHPVVFTTENDSRYSLNTTQAASAFDWNGIHIAEKSRFSSMSNLLISYSVYGLKSQSEDIRVENGVFFQNGQFHFTINDKIQSVQDGFPFSYNVNEDKKTETRSSGNFKKQGIPVILGGLGLTTALLSALSVKSYSGLRNDYNQATEWDKQNDLEKKGNRELTKTLLFGGVSTVTIPTAIILYLKNNRPEEKNKIAVIPALKFTSKGFQVTLRF